MKMFMEYMKKFINNGNKGQQNMPMGMMMPQGNRQGTGVNKTTSQGQRNNPLMNPVNMSMPSMNKGGQQNMSGMRQPNMTNMPNMSNMMQMNPMMNPMMNNQMNLFGNQGMPMQPYMMGQNMMMANPGMQINPAFGMQQQQTGQIDIQWILSNKREFENFPSEKIKKTLGSILYPLVHKQVDNQELTAKVTGMLIDLEVLTVLLS